MLLSEAVGGLRPRLVAALALFGVMFAVGFALAGSAAAHATVVGSSPGDGSRLKTAPGVVSITFDESVGLGGTGYLHVIDERGNRVEVGSAFHPGGNPAKIADRLAPGLGDGTYTGSYRVVSADSHPITGTMRFVVGSGVLGPAVVGPSAVNPKTRNLYVVMRWISFGGLALLGGAWLLLSVWPQGRRDRRARTIVWTGWVACAFGGFVELLVQGPYAAGLVPDLGRWSLLKSTLHTSFGWFHSARLVLLLGLAVVLAVMLHDDRHAARAARVALPLGVGIALTFSLTGHPQTTSPRLFSITADLLHITAMAVWVGGPVMLTAAVLPRREPAELRVVLPVFSRVAFGSVLVLVATGTYAAWRGIGTVHAVIGTTYGLLVVTKIILLLGMLALGNLSRRAIQRRYAPTPVAYAMTDTVSEELAADDPASLSPGDLSPVEVERMRRSVVVEVVLAACILFVTAVLVGQPRGREALATSEQRSVSATAQIGGGRTAQVTVTPGSHGIVTADLSLSPGPAPRTVTATAALPSRQLGPIPLALTADSVGSYTASGIDLPVAGDWVINLVVTTSEFDATTTQLTIHLY